MGSALNLLNAGLIAILIVAALAVPAVRADLGAPGDVKAVADL